MTVQIPALATPVPQSTDPVSFAPRADAFLTSLVPFADAANRQNVENNQLNESTVLAAGVAQSASAAAMAALGAPRFDPAFNYLAGNQAWSPVDAKVYRRLVAGRSAVDPSADSANWKIHMQTKADLGLGNVDNTSDINKPVSTAVQNALNLKETPAGALAQMQGFGLGVATSSLINDLNAHRIGGVFRATAAVMLAAGGGAPEVDCVVEHLPGGTANSGHRQIALPITSSPLYLGRVYQRVNWGGVWQPFREMAHLDSPALTGAPSAPNLKLGNVPSADVNTLDFYEEGVFNPLLLGLTAAGSPVYGNRQGRYTRKGNRVTWSLRVQITSKGGAVGELLIGGLPFLVGTNSGAAGGFSVGEYFGVVTNGLLLLGQHVPGQGQLRVNKLAATETYTSRALFTDISDNFQIFASGQYEV